MYLSNGLQTVYEGFADGCRGGWRELSNGDSAGFKMITGVFATFCRVL
ncbi:hypothetical protein ACFP3I_02385 [Chryseobacterium arachidis]